jgi:cation transport ATPase
MVLSVRRRNHSPLLYLVALIAILTVARWAGLGDRHVLTYVTLGLIVLLLIWGHRINHAASRRTRRSV